MTVTPRTGSRIEELLARSGRFFIPVRSSADLGKCDSPRRPGDGDAVLDRDRWSARQGGPLHTRGELHWSGNKDDKDDITWEICGDRPSVGATVSPE